MAGFDPQSISQALAAGYSDTEIADHLAKAMPNIQQARDAGYSDKDIIAHMNGGASKQAPKSREDTSPMGALSQGVANVTQGFGKTVKDYISPDAGKAMLASGMAQSNPNYKSASEQFANPEDGADNHTLGVDWSKLPRAALEQAPGLALDLGVQALVPKWTGPIGKYIANTATFGGRTLGNEAEKRAAARTGDENAEPSTADKLTALGSTGAQVALGQVGLNKILSPAKVTETGLRGVFQSAGNVAKAAGAEAGVGAGQDFISQAATKAGSDQPFDWQEAKAAGLSSGALGGVFAAPRGVHDAAVAVRTRDFQPDEHMTMAANRLLQNVEKPEDLAVPEKAGPAVKKAQEAVGGELQRAAQSISNPSQDTANAIASARSGNVLNDRELLAIDKENNPLLSSLARQSSALSGLADQGHWNGDRFAGGASEFVRNHAFGLAKLVGGVGAISHAAGQGAIGLDTLSSSLPGAAEAIAAGAAGYKGLQAIDKLTGAYTPAHNFAQKFGNGGAVRPDVPLNQSPTGPKVDPQNSLTPSQPWGPVAPPPQRFKPDIIDPGIAKIVEKLQRQKQAQTARDAMPLLRQLSAQSQPPAPAPGIDASGLNEQVKSALLMASARRKIMGQQQAEAEAAASPMIQEQGGLDEVRNPAMGKRANELIAAANALARLRRQPEEEAPAPTAPQAPSPAPQAPRAQMPPQAPDPQPSAGPGPSGPQPSILPESPYWHLDAKEAADNILKDAIAGEKPIRNQEAYHAGTVRRLRSEESIYNNISTSMKDVKERGDFHKYLSALWGSDSPEVVGQVRDAMVKEFPQHADAIMKHLSDTAIKGLWNTKPKKAA